jgi:hypothetical protein
MTTLNAADHAMTTILSRGGAMMTEAIGRSVEVNTEKDVSPYMIGWGARLMPRISWKMKPMIMFLVKSL